MSNMEDNTSTDAAKAAGNEKVIRGTQKLIQKECVGKTPSSVCDSSSVTLESINDDCLRHIFQYINIVEVGNVAKTCSRFLNFAKDVIFPKEAREICIYFLQGGKTATLSAPEFSSCFSVFTLDNFKSSCSIFGEFVEELTFEFKYPEEKSKLWQTSLILMAKCKYLKTLRISNLHFAGYQTHELQDQIERLQNLKELIFLQSHGITNNWRAVSKSHSKIRKLSLTWAFDEITSHFFEYFRNLSSFTIELHPAIISWKTDDFAKMFNNNSHCLQHLKLDGVSDYESIGKMITDKLQKLESLSLKFELTDKSETIVEIPHLKFLEIRGDERSMNSVMRKLSDIGIIEELKIYGCGFDDEDDNIPPLIFNNLKSICCDVPENVFGFLKSMTRSRMPALQNFDLYEMETTERNRHQILRFIESKIGLKSIWLSLVIYEDANFCLLFLRQLIEILKKPSTPQRPLLNLTIEWIELDEEMVSEID